MLDMLNKYTNERNDFFMKKTIIGVKYEDNYTPKTFSGKLYNYYCKIKVDIGDIVLAPTSSGDKIARVSRTNIPEYSIATSIRPYLKTIESRIDKDLYLRASKVA